MNREIKVGIADMKIARAEGTLITYALGSCVGIAIYDPAIRLGGLLHIMLPESQQPGSPPTYTNLRIRGLQRCFAKCRPTEV